MDSPNDPKAASAEANAHSVNAFACDLYDRIAADEGNVVFSPYSIHQAMHMAFVGAAGETANQMARALRLRGGGRGADSSITLNEDEYGQRFSHEVKIANAMWGIKGYPFHRWYAEQLRNRHQAQFEEVDFADRAAAAGIISDWIEIKTGGRIRNMITPDALHPFIRLMLTNAIYFRADWHNKFDAARTVVAPFHLNRKEKMDVQMMHQMASFRAIETEQFDVIALAYEGFGLSMCVIVPRRLEELPELEKTVLRDGPAVWSRYMRWRRVNLYFPRFRFESSLRLGRPLAEMGMPHAFNTEKADFSGISSEPGFFLSEVIHQTYVDVDEEGTEAAGATATEMTGGAGFHEEKPMELKVDRPFLFAITAQSHSAQTLLFMGRMLRPTPVE